MVNYIICSDGFLYALTEKKLFEELSLQKTVDVFIIVNIII